MAFSRALAGGRAPGEGAVAGDQHAGDVRRGRCLRRSEAFDDDLAGVEFVFALDFLIGQRAGAAGPGRRSGRRGWCRGRGFSRSGLGEAGGVLGVGVNDAADAGEVLVEVQVGGVSEEGRPVPSMTCPVSRERTTMSLGRSLS